MNEFENFTMVKFKWNGDTHYGLFRKDSEESWIEICLVDEIVHFEIIDVSLVTDIKLMNNSLYEDGIYGALIYYFCQNKIVDKEHKSDFERFKKEYLDFLNIISHQFKHVYIGTFNSVEELNNKDAKNGDYAYIKSVEIYKNIYDEPKEKIIYKQYVYSNNVWIYSHCVETISIEI